MDRGPGDERAAFRERMRAADAAVAAAEEALKLAKEHRQAIISADVARPRGFQGNG